MDRILAAPPNVRSGSGRLISLIGDPPNHGTTVFGRAAQQPTRGELTQIGTDFQLNRRESAAIGGIEALLHHHGPDDVGRAHRLARSAKRVEYATFDFPGFEPAIRPADDLGRDRVRLQIRCEQTDRRVDVRQIRAELTELLFETGDLAGDFGPLIPSLTPPKISRTLSDLYGVPAARVALHPRHAGVTR